MSDTEKPQPAKGNPSDDHRDLDELGDKLRQVQDSRKTKSRYARPDDDEMQQSGLGLGMRIGTELIVGVLMGLAIGWFIDRQFGTEPFGLLVFFVLGFAAGILNVVRVANKASETSGGTGNDPKPPQD